METNRISAVEQIWCLKSTDIMKSAAPKNREETKKLLYF